MAKKMREQLLRDRVREARVQVHQGAQQPGWAVRYAKDVEKLRQLVVAFVVADAARAIAMDRYPGPLRADEELFKARLRAQNWLGAKVPSE